MQRRTGNLYRVSRVLIRRFFTPRVDSDCNVVSYALRRRRFRYRLDQFRLVF